MNSQIRTILWAQFRTIRNYLPRTSFGAVLMWLLGLLWYGLFAGIAIGLAVGIPAEPLQALRNYLPLGLLGVLVFWQVFPVLTLSTGWSLELNKLVVYPIRENTLFAIDLLLRLSTAPEMVIVLLGALVGLLRHRNIFLLSPLWLLVYIAFNLFLSLALREWMMRTFKKKRFRELFVLVFVTIAVLPNLLANTTLGTRLKPVFSAVANGRGTPWHEVSALATGSFSVLAAGVWIFWLAAAYLFARHQFALSMRLDHTAAAEVRAIPPHIQKSRLEFLFTIPSRFFRDPFAALLEKEFRILARSPRFRVIFAMACVFSIVVFFPIAFGRGGSSFLANNYLPVVNCYGLLILGEVLLWNVFGFDRSATQFYFVTPVRFQVVLRAKNIVAAIAILTMTLLICLTDELVRHRMTVRSFISSLALTAVMTLLFLGLGNLTSIMIPRPIDPNQAFRNQNSAKASLWLLICFVLMVIPVGLAFVAQWAFGSDLAFFGVLAIDFLIGAIFYAVATESAVERAERERERLLDALSKGPGLMST